MVPFVVLLTGLPAAGKTTLGRPVAEALGLPDVRSDSIKEIHCAVTYETAWEDSSNVRDQAGGTRGTSTPA
jgi:shikimate kinase